MAKCRLRVATLFSGGHIVLLHGDCVNAPGAHWAIGLGNLKARKFLWNFSLLAACGSF